MMDGRAWLTLLGYIAQAAVLVGAYHFGRWSQRREDRKRKP